MPQMTPFRRGRRLPLIVATVAIAVTLSGCTRIRTHQGYQVDKLLTDSIQPGIDNRESVEATLGRPTFTAQFNQGEWYYVSRDLRQLAFSSPKPTAQQVLRINFDQAGNVSSVTRTGLDQVARVSPSGDKTPTLGRHRTLFQEIFGNIGAVGAGGATGGGPTGPGPNGS